MSLKQLDRKCRASTRTASRETKARILQGSPLPQEAWLPCPPLTHLVVAVAIQEVVADVGLQDRLPLLPGMRCGQALQRETQVTNSDQKEVSRGPARSAEGVEG